MEEHIFASATDLAERIRIHAISSEALLHAYLRHIEVFNPHLNAVVQLAGERAVDEARAADRAVARGARLGPLHGVPFTAKDVFDTAGVITTCGVPERAAFVPQHDDLFVARLRAAGAILLGKTNCPPNGAGGDTDNPVYGRTNNPYNLQYTPGGSSGGEAATIAAGGSAFGLGSDSGGSIRLPAHYCGVAGLKPTYGRGGYAVADPRSQAGPLSRYVRDLSVLMEVLAGLYADDVRSIPAPIRDPGAVTLRQCRLAFFVDDTQAPPTAETIAAVRASAQALADAGVQVEEVLPPRIPDARALTERWWRLGELGGADAERLFEEWDEFREDMLTFIEHYDAIMCPADHRPAPPHGTDDARQFNYTLPHSLTGWPCVVVRAGTSPEDLPIGVQVVARPWREDVALALAQQIETDLGGWQRPPL